MWPDPLLNFRNICAERIFLQACLHPSVGHLHALVESTAVEGERIGKWLGVAMPRTPPCHRLPWLMTPAMENYILSLFSLLQAMRPVAELNKRLTGQRNPVLINPVSPGEASDMWPVNKPTDRQVCRPLKCRPLIMRLTRVMAARPVADSGWREEGIHKINDWSPTPDMRLLHHCCLPDVRQVFVVMLDVNHDVARLCSPQLSASWTVAHARTCVWIVFQRTREF